LSIGPALGAQDQRSGPRSPVRQARMIV
jgi:hypothetical protein